MWTQIIGPYKFTDANKCLTIVKACMVQLDQHFDETNFQQNLDKLSLDSKAIRKDEAFSILRQLTANVVDASPKVLESPVHQ